MLGNLFNTLERVGTIRYWHSSVGRGRPKRLTALKKALRAYAYQSRASRYNALCTEGQI